MTKDFTILVIVIALVVASIICIFWGFFNPVAIKILAVLGSILLVFIAVVIYVNSKFYDL